MQAERINVSIIRTCLIVLSACGIETSPAPSAGLDDPRVMKFSGPREFLGDCDCLGNDRELSLSKGRSMTDHLLSLLSLRVTWTLARRGDRESTPGDDAAGQLVSRFLVDRKGS